MTLMEIETMVRQKLNVTERTLPIGAEIQYARESEGDEYVKVAIRGPLASSFQSQQEYTGAVIIFESASHKPGFNNAVQNLLHLLISRFNKNALPVRSKNETAIVIASMYLPDDIKYTEYEFFQPNT